MMNTIEITPETDLEKRIVESTLFQNATQFTKSKGPGHPEKNLREHVSQILDFIDDQQWEKYRTNLRLLGLLHDLGKPQVKYGNNGHLIGKGHSVYSEEIAQDFTQDESLLSQIRIHDKYFGFFKNFTKGKLKLDKFKSVYEGIDLDTLIRFNYADSNNREKDSIIWYEDILNELGLREDKIYELEPGVLL